MSKINLLIICLWGAIGISASVITPEQAAQIAQNHRLQSVTSQRRVASTMQLVRTIPKLSSTEAAYYVFEDAQGFILVAGSDHVPAVLGYADGHYDETAIPDNARQWMTDLVRYLSREAVSAMAPCRTTQAIEPLLENEKIQWNQTDPFNLLCPSVGGQHCVSGCVPTACSQIMRYWKYPATGRGKISYSWNNTTLSADFSQHTYAWDKMLGQYLYHYAWDNDTYQYLTVNDYTDEQAQAVALLMADMGIAAQTDYGINGSNANEKVAAMAMINYFDYDSAIAVISPQYLGVQGFVDSIRTELAAQRVVLLAGTADSGTGHAFLCDGIDSNNLLHINWGWGGYFNGYFAVLDFTPEGQGAGGAADGEGYNNNVRALIGIQPNKGNAPVNQLTLRQMDISDYQLKRTDPLTVTLNMVQNNGLFTWKGGLGVKICDKEYHVVQDYYMYNNASLEFLYYYPVAEFYPTAIGTQLPDGAYKLVAMYTNSTDNNTYFRMLAPQGNAAEYDFTLTHDSVFFQQPAESPYLASLTATDNGDETVTFHWTAQIPAASYIVKVLSGTTLISADTVTATESTIRFYVQGNYSYSWTVIARDEQGQTLEQKDGSGFAFEVNTDYTPTNLTCQAVSNGLRFSWNGAAPAYQLSISYNGTLIYRNVLTEPTFLYPYRQLGTYDWSVRSLNALQTVYVSQEAEAQYVVTNDTPTEVPNMYYIHPQSGKYLINGKMILFNGDQRFDLQGHKL